MEQFVSNSSIDQTQLPNDAAASRLAISAHELLSKPGSSHSPHGMHSSGSAFLPPMEIYEFETRAQNLLADVPVDENKHFKAEDLVRLVQDPKVKGQDAVTLGALYLTYKDDKGDLGREQISHMHLAAEQEQRNFNDLKKLKSSKGFAAVDKNHDGFVNANELKSAPGLKDLTSRAPVLHDMFVDHPEGLKTEDFDRAYNATVKSVDDTRQLMLYSDVLGARLSEARSRTLYGDDKTADGVLRMEDVVQGATGDCYFMAGLAKAAESQPQLIRDAIVDNHDNTYTVTFKGDVDHPVTIPAPTDSELALYARGSEHGIWPAVMEKAYARYEVDVLKRPLNGGTLQDAVDGGYNKEVIELLTGNRATELYTPTVPFRAQDGHRIPNPMSGAQLEDKLTQALDAGKLIALKAMNPEKLPLGLQDHHAYSVVSISNVGDVIVRDPRGTNNPFGWEYTTLTKSDLQKFDLEFNVETDEKLH
jgi:Ca2+-binding EF-hand superfamily protein